MTGEKWLKLPNTKRRSIGQHSRTRDRALLTVFPSTPSARPMARKLIPSFRIRSALAEISWYRKALLLNTATLSSSSATVRIGCSRVHPFLMLKHTTFLGHRFA